MAKKTAEKLPIPYNHRVLIRLDKPEKTTKSGLVLPDTSGEDPRRGTIMACGSIETDDDGEPKYDVLAEGDRVIFEAGYGASRFELDGEKYIFVSYDGIVAVLQ